MAFSGDSIFWVEVEKVVANPFQPRREFDEARLKELAESIRMYGVLQPLTVTKKEIQREDGTFYSEYELIAGERRLRASKLAGLKQVPVIIRTGEETEQEKLELAIIENLQREDLNSVDRAHAFKQLVDLFKLSHSQIAKKMGRSREYVSNTLRLLALPDYMLNALQGGEMSEGHARALLMLSDRHEEQDVLFREVLLKKISVRESERIARKIATDRVRKHKWKDTDPQLIEIERQFTETLGTRVQIQKTDFGGKLTIDYFAPEDLDKILKMIKHEEVAKSDTQKTAAMAVTEELAESIDDSSDVLAALAANIPLDVAEEEAGATGEVDEGGYEAEKISVTEEVSVVPAAADSFSTPVVASVTEPETYQQPQSEPSSLVPEPASTIVSSVSSAPEPELSSVPTPEPIMEASETKAEEPEEKDESDLYGIKNFGI